MKKEEFSDEWKGDWEERKGEYSTNQAGLFRQIRDRKNLEILLAFKGIADTIGAHGRGSVLKRGK